MKKAGSMLFEPAFLFYLGMKRTPTLLVFD